jgi:hypothetical protein
MVRFLEQIIILEGQLYITCYCRWESTAGVHTIHTVGYSLQKWGSPRLTTCVLIHIIGPITSPVFKQKHVKKYWGIEWITDSILGKTVYQQAMSLEPYNNLPTRGRIEWKG